MTHEYQTPKAWGNSPSDGLLALMLSGGGVQHDLALQIRSQRTSHSDTAAIQRGDLFEAIIEDPREMDGNWELFRWIQDFFHWVWPLFYMILLGWVQTLLNAVEALFGYAPPLFLAMYFLQCCTTRSRQVISAKANKRKGLPR